MAGYAFPSLLAPSRVFFLVADMGVVAIAARVLGYAVQFLILHTGQILAFDEASASWNAVAAGPS